MTGDRAPGAAPPEDDDEAKRSRSLAGLATTLAVIVLALALWREAALLAGPGAP